jgi:ribose transport system substrate-binding protein
MLKLNIKRSIINVTIISLALVLFAVWYRNSIAIRSQSRPTSDHYKIYLITTDKQYQYWDYLNRGASDMAKAIGIHYIWDAPKERNYIEQNEVIRRAVNDGADALLIAADDPKMISDAIEDAKSKSVEVIYVDSPAYEEAITTLATNNYNAGILAGQKLLQILDDMNIDSGSVGIVSIELKENSDLREQGFRDVLEKDGKFMILDTVATNGKPEDSQNAAELLIEQNKDIVALFGTNEGTSEGVGNAIKENGNSIIGIGFDETDRMRQLLEEGSLKAIVNQNPYTMGYLGMAQAVAAILGKDTGPHFIDTGASVVETESEENGN